MYEVSMTFALHHIDIAKIGPLVTLQLKINVLDD